MYDNTPISTYLKERDFKRFRNMLYASWHTEASAEIKKEFNDWMSKLNEEEQKEFGNIVNWKKIALLSAIGSPFRFFKRHSPVRKGRTEIRSPTLTSPLPSTGKYLHSPTLTSPLRNMVTRLRSYSPFRKNKKG